MSLTLDEVALRVARIAEIERREGWPSPGPRKYMYRGRTVVSREFLLRSLFSIGPSGGAGVDLGKIIKSGRFGMIGTLVFGKSVRLNINADAIYFKSNIRAFYSQARMTVKCSTSPESGALSGEIRARQRIQMTDVVRVPQLVSSGTTSDKCEYLLEEVVPTAGRLAASADVDRLATQLWEFYVANGLNWQPVGEAINPDAEWSRFLSHCDDLELEVPTGLRSVPACMTGSDRGPRVPTGLGHGDLAAENVLVAEGNIYLVDWEHALRGMILPDIVRLNADLPGLLAAFLRRAASAAPDPTSLLRADDHIAVATVIGANRRLQRMESSPAPLARRTLADRKKRKVQKLIRSYLAARQAE